jgi:hypothetical protein
MKGFAGFLGSYALLVAIGLALVAGLGLLNADDSGIVLPAVLITPLVLWGLEFAMLLPEMRRVPKVPPPEAEEE